MLWDLKTALYIHALEKKKTNLQSVPKDGLTLEILVWDVSGSPVLRQTGLMLTNIANRSSHIFLRFKAGLNLNL